MDFYNIHSRKELVSFKQAVSGGVKDSSCLYMPVTLPVFSNRFIDLLPSLTNIEIAFEICREMFSDVFTDDEIMDLVESTFNFNFPLIQLADNLFVFELFHGPTAAFKDVGAAFMSNLFVKLGKNSAKKNIVLTATSGDTGGAVANAFFGKENIEVIILFPSGLISEFQQKQISGLGGNIKAIEVKGSFDDCQALVKKAYADEKLNEQFNLTTANSINFARLFPQSIYYFFIFSQLAKINKQHCVNISVPCGNYGNITAGALAKKMGLPLNSFIASNNLNDASTNYFKNSVFEIKNTVHTISSAMDVGNPSNFFRLLELYNNSYTLVLKDINGFSFTDGETLKAMQELYIKYKYIADPHTAVAYMGTKKIGVNANAANVFLSTAHPFKFNNQVEKALNTALDCEEKFKSILDRSNHSLTINNNYHELFQTIYALS